MIFCTILLTIYKIFYYKVRVSTGSVETRWLGGSFGMVYRNNADRLGSGFISVCLETRWLGHLGGFHVLERPCIRRVIVQYTWKCDYEQVSQVMYRGQGDTGHNQRHVTKVRTRRSEKAEIDV